MSDKNKIKFTRGDRIFSVVVAVFFLICAIACFHQYQEEVYQKNAIDSGVIVEAKLVRVKSHSGTIGDRSYTDYYLEYSYIDKNGLEYTGKYGPSFKDKTQAQMHLGFKIQIYIDGDGHSIPVGGKPQLALMMTFSILLSLAVVASIVMYIYQLNNPITKEQKAELQEEKESQRIAYWQQKKDEHDKKYGEESLDELRKTREDLENLRIQYAEQDKLWREYEQVKKKYKKKGINYFYWDFLRDKQIQLPEKENNIAEMNKENEK